MILKKIDNIISDLYAYFFSKGILSKVNNKLMDYVLRARGYRNSSNFDESGEKFFIVKILAPSQPKLCIDIGANVGDYTFKLLQSTNTKVISFEPLMFPNILEKLNEKKKLFSGRVTIENIGIGATDSNLTINYNPKFLGHASFIKEVNKISFVSNEKKTIVPVTSLDSYCVKHNILEIDLIKIDTEGYEKEVFEGAKRVFSKLKPKFIQIEYNKHQMFRGTTLNYFSEQLPGYEVFQLIPNGWVKINPLDPYANIYHFSNFVFVRSN